jgi:hypothetical protein
LYEGFDGGHSAYRGAGAHKVLNIAKYYFIKWLIAQALVQMY